MQNKLNHVSIQHNVAQFKERKAVKQNVLCRNHHPIRPQAIRNITTYTPAVRFFPNGQCPTAPPGIPPAPQSTLNPNNSQGGNSAIQDCLRSDNEQALRRTVVDALAPPTHAYYTVQDSVDLIQKYIIFNKVSVFSFSHTTGSLYLH